MYNKNIITNHTLGKKTRFEHMSKNFNTAEYYNIFRHSAVQLWTNN